jgi:acyl carrier protein
MYRLSGKPGHPRPYTACWTFVRRTNLDVQREVITIVGRVLDLGKRSAAFGRETPLLGSVPELDSMAVATLITSLEDHFGFTVDDDEIDGSTFATIGALADFVQGKLAA